MPLVTTARPDLSLSSQTTALHLTESFHSTKDHDCAKRGHGKNDVAQRQAAVVQEVDKFHAKDRGEEGGMRDGSRLESFGKVGEVGTELDEPLQHNRVSTCVRKLAVLKRTGVGSL